MTIAKRLLYLSMYKLGRPLANMSSLDVLSFYHTYNKTFTWLLQKQQKLKAYKNRSYIY